MSGMTGEGVVYLFGGGGAILAALRALGPLFAEWIADRRNRREHELAMRREELIAMVCNDERDEPARRLRDLLATGEARPTPSAASLTSSSTAHHVSHSVTSADSPEESSSGNAA